MSRRNPPFGNYRRDAERADHAHPVSGNLHQWCLGRSLPAHRGEYWSRDGWQPADHLSIRETVRRSLAEIKAFWQEKEVWPETEPRELYGPAVHEPDEFIFMDRGGDPIPDRSALEEAYVREYEEHGTLAFASEDHRRHWEYYEGLEPVEGDLF